MPNPDALLRPPASNRASRGGRFEHGAAKRQPPSAALRPSHRPSPLARRFLLTSLRPARHRFAFQLFGVCRSDHRVL